MRIIEVVADAGHLDTLAGVAEQHHVVDFWAGPPGDDGRAAIRLLVDDASRQQVIDTLQGLLGGGSNYRIVILPVEAVLPRALPASVTAQDKGGGETREELYNDIERGARLDSNFLLMVFLSTIVASIGLIENNVAVVIGAMVIAPLLGPNIALALATSLGDHPLIWKSLKTNLAGLSLSLVIAVA
ncbi:MAG: TIGR00341 family protein, partial [Gammaproteobacteria bacterium]|nr:TIGR00341 family protein [Gammaproteobacteria bacterium]